MGFEWVFLERGAELATVSGLQDAPWWVLQRRDSVAPHPFSCVRADPGQHRLCVRRHKVMESPR